MRSVIATVFQCAGLVALVVAGFLWCVPAGVFAAGAVSFVVGYDLSDL